MGVHSLWKILEPSSKAVRLESLSRRKLAIDASIWIYQFLKAVRDKSGVALSKAYIVGFFRRICKLLYFGILPVFVFDGGAPALKRQTILKRKERRQGNRDNAENTARRLLALQLQRQKDNQDEPKSTNDTIDLKYMDQIDNISPNQQKQEPKFRASDEYDLPKIEGFRLKKDDTRLISEKDIDTSVISQANADELDGINLNTIDPSSKEFENLPLTTQYMVLSQLRLRSRLRMGYSKEQLENIFPNSLDFSKFQIQMVQKRNYFTQKLMGISGMDVDVEKRNEEVKRVAGERGKAYKILKTEGGWSLSLDNEEHGTLIKPIDLDKELNKEKKKAENPLYKDNSEDEDDDIEWEDVSLESNTRNKMSYSIGSLPLPPKPDVIDDTESGTIRSFTFSPEKKKKQKTDDHGFDDIDNDIFEQIEQHELLQAIALSKKDLQKDLELEEALTKYVLPEVETFKDSVIEEDIEEDIEEEEALDIFEDVDIPETLSQPKKQSNDIIKEHSIDQRTTRTQSELNHFLHLNDMPISGNDKPGTVASSGALNSSIPQFQEQSTKNSSLVNEKRLDKFKEPLDEKFKSRNKAPSWFSSDFKLSTSKSMLLNHQQKKNEQENGLIPWFEAKELLERKQENVNPGKINEDNEVQLAEYNEVTETRDCNENEPDSKDGRNSGDSEENNNRNDNPVVMDYEFFESDEEELENQLVEEEKEHEQFTKDLNTSVIENFRSIDSETSLRQQYKNEKRDSDEVTIEMIREVQELLSFFGIPYVTAPMEAEAQCAELLQLNLVDGIITDDSDVFLFGGDKVYKNMFHEKHYVEFYNGSNIEKELGLDRMKLINLAHLLGSDYTEGLKGIGPVNAMEILANFDGDLSKFRDWFNDSQLDLNKQKEDNSFQKMLRKKLVKNDVIIDKSFPNKVIDLAYLQPEVDPDRTGFKWGKPDLDRIRNYLMDQVGWRKERADEVLLPLIKHLNKKEREGAQSTLTEFFDKSDLSGFNRISKNKRISEATGKIKRHKR